MGTGRRGIGFILPLLFSTFLLTNPLHLFSFPPLLYSSPTSFIMGKVRRGSGLVAEVQVEVKVKHVYLSTITPPNCPSIFTSTLYNRSTKLSYLQVNFHNRSTKLSYLHVNSFTTVPPNCLSIFNFPLSLHQIVHLQVNFPNRSTKLLIYLHVNFSTVVPPNCLSVFVSAFPKCYTKLSILTSTFSIAPPKCLSSP